MNLDQIFGLIIIVVSTTLIGSFILAIIAFARAGRAERANSESARLLSNIVVAMQAQEREIANLRRHIAPLAGEAPPPAETFPLFIAEETASQPEMAPSAPEAVEDAPFLPEPEPSRAEPAAPRWARGGLERQFGAVLPVWIGGIALAFAGFFLVKYSIDNDLIDEKMRVSFGFILGLALIAGAHYLRIKSSVAESTRIAQALTGAGLAVLYVSIYAGTSLYHFLPPLMGFAGMAATTAGAVLLALRHGPPIALMGMVGGFLTPALISTGHPSALSLYAYLFLVYAALMIVIRRQGWWPLAFPATIFVFGWVLLWVFQIESMRGETLWVGLFLIAVAATLVAATRERYAEETAAIQSWRQVLSPQNRMLALNVMAVAGALGMMAVVAFNKGFGLYDWALFGVLSLGAVFLAYFDTWRYGYAPWAAMAVAAVMLAGWMPGSPSEFAIVITAFGVLFVASGFLLLPSAEAPLLWSGLSTAAALGYFLLGYFRLRFDIPALPQPRMDVAPSTRPTEPLLDAARETAASIIHVWGSIAMLLSLLFLSAAFWAARRFPPSPTKERVLATYALATTAFLAIALSIELKREFLSVAIAAELLAVAWVATKTQIPSLRAIAALLGTGFAFLLLPQILLLAQLAMLSVAGVHLYIYNSLPVVDFPAFQLALPAIFFLMASWLFRPGGDGLLTRTLEFAALALIGMWGYYTMTALFHPGDSVLNTRPGYFERGIVTNVLFVFGLACLMIARLFGRRAFLQAGVLLVAVALFRIFYFDLFLRNPIWSRDTVPGLPLLNALALTLLVPIAWIWLVAREFVTTGSARLTRFAGRAGAVTLILVFAWISLEIRRLYQGPWLGGSFTSDAEFYTYSVAWLLFGLALLFIGTLKGHQMLRYASLAVVLLAVSKVFLLDAGNLKGLYRVFSFLGLGLSLLGLSYFYGRFVFAKPAPEPAASEAPAPSS